MPYKDKEIMKTYQREWMRRRRQDWIDANGPCKVCGSVERLEVDHINPNEKSLNPTKVWSLTEEKRNLELAKCQVLCNTCHLQKTLKERAERKAVKEDA
jgi:5-methylcytosine-specific restriction endonuclease McrA